MGTVYLARDLRLDRRIALKFIDPERFSADDSDAQQRLLHEARAASGLNHPNICQVYDVGGEGRESWIAMEYVEGESLASILRARRLTPDTTVRIGRQIAEALGHAHQRGIVHRDLKSANIVCDRDGHPKILDFGIARRLSQDIGKESTRILTVAAASGIEGTLPYMAPEVISGAPQDERSDLWSFGVVLYEMLTGALPFTGRNSFDLAAAIVQGSVAPLPESVPPPLAHIVARLLSREPAARYATAAETAAALDALSEHPAQPRRGRRAFTARYAAAALALVAVTAAVAWWWRRDATLQLGEQRLISTSATPQRAPSYSSDGSMLAYVAPDAMGIQQIWVQPPAPAPAIQITSGKSNASRPRWLTKTNQILFALAGQGLWTVSPTGGTPTRLIERGTSPNVSRDGSRIVFEDQRLLWTAVADGSDVRPVTGFKPSAYSLPLTPALSPDGSTIAYFSAEFGPNGDFWTIPAAGGTPKQLTNDLREGGWPVWTADGRDIIVSSARAGSRTLWQIPVDGGQPSALTTGAGEDDQPDLTADGRQIAYTNVRNTWELRVRDLASGDERSLLQRGLETLFPMFSPDGTRIVYFGRSDYAVAIFTIGVDGSDPRQLTSGRELNHQPRWGHDGQSVYFFQHHPAVSFRRVPALGGPSEGFRQWNWETSMMPYFDPTGRFLAYVRGRRPGAPPDVSEHTVIHDVTTQEERVWPEPHTHVNGWSPDGLWLVGTQHAPGGTTVVTCRVADAECRAITRGTAPKWSPRGDRIYFLRSAATGGSQELWTIAVDGGDERRIGDLGSFRPIDVFIDVSSTGLVAWAPMRAGQPQVWAATVR
jgi:eukaryotic-like serine/threonine-protein kinase